MTLSEHLKAGNVLLWLAVVAVVVIAYTFRANITGWLQGADVPAPVLTYTK